MTATDGDGEGLAGGVGVTIGAAEPDAGGFVGVSDGVSTGDGVAEAVVSVGVGVEVGPGSALASDTTEIVPRSAELGSLATMMREPSGDPMTVEASWLRATAWLSTVVPVPHGWVEAVGQTVSTFPILYV